MTEEGFPGASARESEDLRERPLGSGELLDRARRAVPGAQWELREWIRGVALDAIRGWALDAENLASDFADDCIRDQAKRLRGFDLDRDSLRAYLIKSVRRDAKRLMDRGAREPHFASPEGQYDEHLAESALIERRYESFLRRLTPEARLIWSLILEGETQAYVAHLLNKPPGTIACKVSALKKTFRRLLNGDVN